MGISSAMNAGVMGLGVNSSKLATISDNIANSETKGYKRATIEFNSLVLSERPTSYDAGGVRASTVRAIEDQGAIVSTRNVMDLAISGNGFLPVADIAEVRRGDPLSMMLTRTGAFRPDFNGLMQTASGLTLLGWQADSSGEFGNVIRDGVSGLAPVQIDALSLASERTTEINLKANLKASAEIGDTYIMPVEYHNSLGGTSYLDLRYTKVSAGSRDAEEVTGGPFPLPAGTGVGPEWRLDIFERPDGGYRNADGERINEINVPPRSTWTITFDDQVDTRNVGGMRSIVRAEQATNAAGEPLFSFDGLTYSREGSRFYDDDGDLAFQIAPSGGTNAGSILNDTDDVILRLAQSGPYKGSYLSAESLTTNDRTDDTADADDVAFFLIDQPGSPHHGKFVNKTGTPPPAVDDANYIVDGPFAPVMVDASTFDDDDGAFEDGVISFNLTRDAGELRLGIGKEGTANGLMQIDANYQVLQVTKNGSPASSLIGIEIDETGLLDAIFDSGFRKTLYKIPVAHVQNPNGMKTLDGQAFALTRASGSPYLYDAGSGPTGALISSALEESTTDIAEELTQLIKTQRAYSSNAKIIQTVDEMLQETTNLKR